MFLRAILSAAVTAIPAAMLVGTIHAAPAASLPAPVATLPGPAAVAVARAAITSCPPAAASGCDPSGPIVAIGDSVTYGYGATMVAYSTPPATSWPADLERTLGVPVVNAGVNGDTAYSVLHPTAQGFGHRPPALQLPALLALHPRLVVVGFGMAEAVYGWPQSEAVADLDTLLGAIGDIPTVILGSHVDCAGQPFCHSQASHFDGGSGWDAELRALAARHHSGLLLDSQAGLAAAGDMEDALHPNAAGYRVLAARIAPVVRDRLAAASAGHPAGGRLLHS
ncbi:MAG TPA: GDSL-type esterase/lipase family protein [Candidatus Dormibacteraeota bacterium]|jgi:lysophospholipase L1-like esterase|nr:GDSL-type esterase/lipase family protein [Candidatus Dormibacteraeota bacterium]